MEPLGYFWHVLHEKCSVCMHRVASEDPDAPLRDPFLYVLEYGLGDVFVRVSRIYTRLRETRLGRLQDESCDDITGARVGGRT